MESVWLRRLRRLTGLFYSPSNVLFDWVTVDESYNNITGEAFQQYLFDKVLSGEPLLVTRFGSTECQCLVDTLNQPTLSNKLRFVFHGSTYYGWKPQTATNMGIASGFYPATGESMLKFRDLILDVLPQVDVLASWLKQEKCFAPYFKNWAHLHKCQLRDLQPFHFSNPWTAALKCKKVLVIHPFEATIQHQWKNRTKLFANPDVLPECELITLKAVQSIAGNHPDEYPTWFDALEAMERQIDNIDFDVAIIGCGAYGMPLAAYCKSIGKQAVHMGGAVQYLFGIRSKRADESNPEVAALYNDYWIYPLPEDRPKDLEKVEGGCYW